MTKKKTTNINLTENLKKLEEIADWFDEQEDVDVEEGLIKVKEASGLMKESQDRLTQVKNEFNEIKKEITGSIDEVSEEESPSKESDNLPF
ncbi:MAG: hypothetical protein WD048_13195 [Chitinophagales bacterium]